MTRRSGPLFHVALPEDWDEALRSGCYVMSTRGQTVAEVGFAHLAYEHQCAGVLERYYADRPDALVLLVDPTLLVDAVKDEASVEGGEAFPHLYGALPIHAVIAQMEACDMR